MSKGAIGMIAFIIILGLILLVEYFVVSYLVRFEYVVGRFMSEVPVLSEADKVETYVRSFQGAVELSLLQGLYETKDQSQGLWYDYGSNIPDLNTIEGIIIQKTEANVKQYLTEYVSFANNNAIEMELSDPSAISGGNIPLDRWEDRSVSIEFSGIAFIGRKGDLEINREFHPSGRVRTQFKRVWDLTNNLIASDEIGNKTREKINGISENDCNMNKAKSLVEEALKNEETTFNENEENKNNKINIELILENIGVTPIFVDSTFSYCKVSATVKVTMEDEMYKYPVYDGSGVIEDYLGLIYRIRTGN